MDIYFRMTLNCNLECSHCYCEAGPGQASISIGDFKKVVDNMPDRVNDICLSGGEVFTRKRLLYAGLEYLQESHVDVRRLSVQTNGYWAKDEATAKKTLEDLVELGVDQIDVSSNDVWHFFAGLDLSRPRLLGKIVEEMELGPLRREGRYSRGMNVFPMGRALEVDKKKWQYYGSQGRCFDYSGATIGIDEKGLVYPCVIQVPGTELGDAREEKISKIVKNGRRREPFKTLTSRDGARRLAWRAGMTNKEMQKNPLYTKGSRCGLCLHLFSEGMVKTNK